MASENSRPSSSARAGGLSVYMDIWIYLYTHMCMYIYRYLKVCVDSLRELATFFQRARRGHQSVLRRAAAALRFAAKISAVLGSELCHL